MSRTNQLKSLSIIRVIFIFFIGLLAASIPVANGVLYSKFGKSHYSAAHGRTKNRIKALYLTLALLLPFYPFYLYGVNEHRITGIFDPLGYLASLIFELGDLGYGIAEFCDEHKLLNYFFFVTLLPALINAFHFEKFKSNQYS